MQIIYSVEEAPKTFTKSIFLAGPSPRDASHYNWRPDAIKELENLGYDGVVFVPLPRNGEWTRDYDAQVDWEYKHLNMADIVAFWVPRDLKDMPAFTTNVEFGMFYESGKVVLGHPDGAPGMRYIVHHAKHEQIPVYTDLAETMKESVRRIGDGAIRADGERMIPLHIWNLPYFKAWHEAQKQVGNRLENARLLWSFRVGKEKQTTFAYALYVDVFIAAEKRNKTNEFVIMRPDISTVVAFFKHPNPADTEIILVREFRSPGRTTDGYIHELPGGSSWNKDEDAREIAAHEFVDETGFSIDATRLRPIGERQLSGTLSSHQAHAYAYELNASEIEKLRNDAATKTIHGVSEDTERTNVEILRLGDLLEQKSNTIDWSMMGIILSALH